MSEFFDYPEETQNQQNQQNPQQEQQEQPNQQQPRRRYHVSRESEQKEQQFRPCSRRGEFHQQHNKSLSFAELTSGGRNENDKPVVQRRQREQQKSFVGVVMQTENKEETQNIKINEERIKRQRVAVPSYDNFAEKGNREKAIKRKPQQTSNIFGEAPAPSPRKQRERDINPITAAFEVSGPQAMPPPKKVSDINKQSTETTKERPQRQFAKPKPIGFDSFGEREPTNQTPERPRTTSRINEQSTPGTTNIRRAHPMSGTPSHIFRKNENVERTPSRDEQRKKYEEDLAKTRELNNQFNKQLFLSASLKNSDADGDVKMDEVQTHKARRRQERIGKCEMETTFGF